MYQKSWMSPYVLCLVRSQIGVIVNQKGLVHFVQGPKYTFNLL